MIREVEEQSLNAWPALQTLLYDGWVMRFADGYTRRANSINPLYQSTVDLATKVEVCERIYASMGRDVVYKLTNESQPCGLDSFLEQSGYAREAATSVQMLELRPAATLESRTFLGTPSPTDTWLSTFCFLNNVAPRHLPTMKGLFNNLVSPACFGALRDGSDTTALGLAVLQRESIWLFDIVTAPERRRQGMGRELIRNLVGWGIQNGATHCYLQVMQNNLPALSLYRQFGFRECYEYWYRVKAHQPDLR
jgi:N-acetylglutamate synthase